MTNIANDTSVQAPEAAPFDSAAEAAFDAELTSAAQRAAEANGTALGKDSEGAEGAEDTVAGEPEEDAQKDAGDAKPSSRLAAALARKRAKLRAERAAFETERAAHKTALEEAASLKARLQKFREDPDSIVAELGLDDAWYDTLTRKRLGDAGSKPTPEQERLARLEAEIKAEKEARAALEASAMEAKATEMRGQFLTLAKDRPNTAVYEDADIIEAAEALGRHLIESGSGWSSLEGLADALEERLAEAHAEQEARLAKRHGSKAQPKPAVTPPSKGTSAPKTVTGAMSGRATAPRQTTHEERVALAKRQLEEDMRG